MTVGSKSQTAKTPLVCHGQSNPEEISTCYEKQICHTQFNLSENWKCSFGLLLLFIQGYLKILGQTSKVSSSQQNKEKSSNKHVRK
jgi:hypothetical protein